MTFLEGNPSEEIYLNRDFQNEENFLDDGTSSSTLLEEITTLRPDLEHAYNICLHKLYGTAL